MPTAQEIEQSLQKDPTFIGLMESDQEKAIQYAEEALKMADERPEEQATPKAQDGPVRTYARPILEAAGSIGGGVIGAAGGPAGMIAGGVLGGAGGSALADVAEQFAGEQKPPASMPEAMSNTVRNLQTGAIAELGGQVLNLGVKGVQALKAPLAGLIDPAKKRVMNLAKAMGVELSPGDITGSHTLAMFIEGISERTPFSAGQVHNFRMDGLKKLVERRNTLLEKGGTPAAIEETGLHIQRRTQDLMDELGVTNDTLRKEFMETTLKKLGSQESFEALGQRGQEAVTTLLANESRRVSNLYSEAFSLAPPGARVIPTEMNTQAQTIRQSLENIDESLIHPKVLAMLQQFNRSGNKAYDTQQRLLEEAMVGVPERVKPQVMQEFLGGKPLEQPGYDPHELNALRSRINTAIDELDAGLKLTGEVGVKGVGKGSQNMDRKILVDLKKALDNDIDEFARQSGDTSQGAINLARLTAGEKLAPTIDVGDSWLNKHVTVGRVHQMFHGNPQVATSYHTPLREIDGIQYVKLEGVDPEVKAVKLINGQWEVVGRARFEREGKVWIPETIAVSPDYQRRGVGTHLLDLIRETTDKPLNLTSVSRGTVTEPGANFLNKYNEQATRGNFNSALATARAEAGKVKAFAGQKGVQTFLKAQPQEAARMLAQSKDLQAIRQLKTTMGQAFKPVEQAFANEMLGMGLEKTIGPSFLRTQLQKYPKGVAEAMLGEGKVAQISNLAKQLEAMDATAVQNPIFKTILKSSPERVVDLIVKPGNTENLQVIRKTLGQEAVHDIARGMANKILRKPEFNAPQEEFMISPAKLLTGMRRLGDDTLNELFKHDPKFLTEMKELSDVANAAQGAARLAANPSGTGQSLIAFGEASMMIINPASGLKVVMGIPMATKLYLSPTGRKWLTTGFKTSPTSPEAAKIFGKLMGVATADATVLPAPLGP